MSTPHAYIEISSYIGEAERQTIEDLINAASPASPHPVAFHGNMTCWFDFEAHVTLRDGDLVERTKPLITANLWNDSNLPPDGSWPASRPDVVMIAEYQEVFGNYEWELRASIEYLQSGQSRTLTQLVTLGQFGLGAAAPSGRSAARQPGRSATVEIKAPNEWNPDHYYASEYIDVTNVVDIEETEMRHITAEWRRELLNVNWYYPMQFMSKRELVCVEIGEDDWEYETWRSVARGWRRDLGDLLEQLPNYEPHVLLCSEYAEIDFSKDQYDIDLDYRLYVRADVLKQSQMKTLRDSLMQWKFRQI